MKTKKKNNVQFIVIFIKNMSYFYLDIFCNKLCSNLINGFVYFYGRMTILKKKIVFFIIIRI